MQELASIIGGELVRTGTGWLYAEDPEMRSRGDEEARRSKTNRWTIDSETTEYWDIHDEHDVGALCNLPIVASWGSTGAYDARARHLPTLTHHILKRIRPGVRQAREASLRLEFKMRAKDVVREVETRK